VTPKQRAKIRASKVLFWATQPELPAIDRFWANVHKTPTCWLWTRTTSVGYGLFNVGRHARQPFRRQMRAHRFLWFHLHGSVPTKMFVCHRCDVRLCVRPSHLFIGTARDNIQDAARKGRLYPWWRHRWRG
jgi:hypothetical protein